MNEVFYSYRRKGPRQENAYFVYFRPMWQKKNISELLEKVRVVYEDAPIIVFFFTGYKEGGRQEVPGCSQRKK